MIPTAYPILNNKKWLQNAYEVKKIGMRKIMSIVECKSSNTVRQALIRHGIKIRNINENRLNDENFIYNEEIITGCLLGDGSLVRYNKHSADSWPYFKHKNNSVEYEKYLAELLFKNPSCPKKDRNSFSIRSKINNKLMKCYDKWYTNGIKTIPADLIITPKTLLIWFLDDGSSYRRKRASRQILITLCTDCFSLDEVKLLCRKIEVLGIRPAIKKTSNRGNMCYRITISQSQADKFYEIIGPCPVKYYDYKWK